MPALELKGLAGGWGETTVIEKSPTKEVIVVDPR